MFWVVQISHLASNENGSALPHTLLQQLRHLIPILHSTQHLYKKWHLKKVFPPLISIKGEAFWDSLFTIVYQGTQFTATEFKTRTQESREITNFLRYNQPMYAEKDIKLQIRKAQ